ncbi:MAG: hypothetical protein Q8L53_05620 [Aestuariivirga sp.]|nr:hypothetical protein [Aestuariivirga sp.]
MAELQRVVQGPGLCLRRALRHHNDLDVRRQIKFLQRVAEVRIELFDDDLDFQFFRRVVPALCIKRTKTA